MRHKAVALWLALAAASAQAACSRELHVGVSELGYGAYQRDGLWMGIVPELIGELSQRSGCRLKLVGRPRARVLLEFEQGQLDVITSVMRAPDRERIGQFLPYAYAEQDLIVLGEPVPHTLEELRRMPDLKLGVVRGVRLSPRLDDLINAMLASRQAEYSPDFDNLAAKLNAGRLRAALIPSVIHVKQRHDGLLPAQLTIVDLPESQPEPIGIYVNRQQVSDDDLQLLARHLEMLKREGRVLAIYQRHVGEAETRRLFRSEAVR